jgi:hypothetical protein
MPTVADGCHELQNRPMGETGTEHLLKSRGNPPDSSARGTESGTLGPTQAAAHPSPRISAIPLDLKIVMDAWASLSAPIRAGMVAMVEEMCRR